jgi:hypothetical protein
MCTVGKPGWPEAQNPEAITMGLAKPSRFQQSAQ